MTTAAQDTKMTHRQGESNMGKLEDKDLREQLGGVVAMVSRLKDRCDALKNRLLFHVDQGEGLTQIQLAEVYTEINRILGCPRDTDGDGNCGRLACPNCGRYRLR